MSTNDTKPVPTLSPDGWVRATAQKCDYIASYFLLSQYSQSYLYKGQINSFVWILAEYKDNLKMIEAETKKALERMFSSYFSRCSVEVTSKVTEDQKASLYIYVEVTDADNKTFKLGKVATIMNSKLEKIANINNYGHD